MVPNFDDLDPRQDLYATRVVERLLQAAIEVDASDIHIEKSQADVQFRVRVDGVLIHWSRCPDGQSSSILGRVKALARLVTYRHDIPQEGRIFLAEQQLEARVGTLPTLHGERAVIRLSNRRAVDWLPNQLGLGGKALERLLQTLASTSGVLLITGPAGAGKTTTAYACMRHLASGSALRSLVSLEDPIESELPGVSQSQINPSVGYTWADGLKALLRQDPEVMLVGEIRDPETATVVFQAAMTGQLVIATMHARSAGDAVRRLLDMHVPVHHIRSALDYLLCQRLVRTPMDAAEDAPRRVLATELLPEIEGELAESIAAGASTLEILRAARACGMTEVVGT
ncbi:MAG: ATPase, T2SS/T4P/T4SS family [Pirellulaceae bacterium]